MQIFTIKIEQGTNDHIYQVKGIGPDGKMISQHPFSWQPDGHWQALLSRLQTSGSVNSKEIERLGKDLFEEIIDPRFEKALWEAVGKVGERQRIRLRFIIEPQELGGIPWEILHDREGFLSARSQLPIVRQMRDVIPAIKQLKIRGRLKVLFVGASPEGMDFIDIQRAAKDLRQHLLRDEQQKKIDLHVLLHASPEDLRSKLQDEFHILFFLGHGSSQCIYLDSGFGEIDPQTGQRQSSEPYALTAEALAKELEGKSTRLVIFAACDTLSPSAPGTPYNNFGYELSRRAKLPSVVAMQYKIGTHAAINFASWFFESLASFHPVDVAMAEARKAITQEAFDGKDFAAPVLLLQTEDANLFEPWRNIPAVIAAVAAFLLLLALVLQFLFFQPDRQDILIAQQTSQAESTRRAAAEKTREVESQARMTAQAMEALRGKEAEQQSNIAKARRLASQATSVEDSQLGLLLAVESINHAISSEGIEAITTLLSRSYSSIVEVPFEEPKVDNELFLGDTTLYTLDRFEQQPGILRYDPQLNRLVKPVLVSNNNQWEIRVYFWQEGEWGQPRLLKRTVTPSEDQFRQPIEWVRFSADGRICAYIEGANLNLWDTKADQAIARREFSEPIMHIAAAKQVNLLLVFTAKNAYVLDMNTGDVINTFNPPGAIYAAWISGDGSYLALQIGNEEELNSSLLIYKAADAQPVLTRNAVYFAGFSPSNRYIALLPSTGDKYESLYELSQIELYDLSQGSQITTLSDVSYEGFHPVADQLLVHMQESTTLQLFDVPAAQFTASYQHPDQCDSMIGEVSSLLHSAGFSSDGTLLATSCSDGQVFVWDTATATLLSRWNTEHVVDTLVFSPDKTLLATANITALPVNVIDSNQLEIWEVRSGNLRGRLEHGPLEQKLDFLSNYVSSVLFSPKGSWLATTDQNNSLRILDLTSSWAKEAATFQHDQPGLPGSVANAWSYAISYFSPTAPLVGVSGGNGNIELWDFGANREIYRMEGEGIEATQRLVFSPDGRWIAASGVFCQTGPPCPNSIRILDSQTGQSFRVDVKQDTFIQNVGPEEPLIAFSHDSQALVAAWEGGQVNLWEIGTWKLKASTDFHRKIRFLVAAAGAPWYILGFDDGQVVILQQGDRGLEQKMSVTLADLSAVAISPDGKRFAAGSNTGEVVLWETGVAQAAANRALTGQIGFVGFSADGKLFGASDGDIVNIWSVDDSQLSYIFQQPEGFGQFSYSTDAQWTMTGISGQLLLLETSGGREVARFPNSYLPALSPDGKYFTSATEVNGTVGVWRWHPQELIEVACRRIRRPLTKQEWVKYLGNEEYRTTCESQE